MELTIDSRAADLAATPAVPRFDVDALSDLAALRDGRSLKITLPATARNLALFGHADHPNAAGVFNAAAHRASLSAEGVELFSGSVRLLEHSREGLAIEIREGAAEWVTAAARRRVEEASVEYSAVLSPTEVCRSWSDSSPVKFFPILRDTYPTHHSGGDLLPDDRLLSVDDYHPFIHLATLLERIFADAGYELHSDLFATRFFRSLYISGAYPARRIGALEQRMGFLAGRTGEATASASSTGRVYADPSALYNSVGNIVQTADRNAVDGDGNAMTGLYNNGNCFRVEQGRILFRPLTAVDAGFDYHLRYTTGHRILSRERLAGFDTIRLGPATRVAFRLANRYEDRRGGIVPNHSYRAIVFNHEAGATYRLTYTLDGVAGTYWAGFSARSAVVTTPAEGVVERPVMMHLVGGVWRPYTGDWALYDGHIGERGETTVEVDLRSAAESLSASSPKRFDTIIFEGAEEGMELTLHKECSVRAHFQSSPAIGSAVAFKDVAVLGIRQIELLEAVAHLFNLRFHTDRPLHRVRVEPEGGFFGVNEVDWSSRIELADGVGIVELAPENRERRTLCYLAGDGAVSRFESAEGVRFGAWSFESGSAAAKTGGEERANPLFAPTLNAAAAGSQHPSALMLQVGDRDDTDAGEAFTPRIVGYLGLHPLPAGQRWPSPSEGAAYPLAAFHFAGDDAAAGFTLCFEDRDGVAGLNRFHEPQYLRESCRERVRVRVRMEPHRYAALFIPDNGGAEIRSRFVLDTGRGRIWATLAAVGAYDPDEGVVECTFNRLANDPS